MRGDLIMAYRLCEEHNEYFVCSKIAARLLGLTPRMLQRKRKLCVGPRYYVHANNNIRYQIKDLIAYLNSVCVPA